MDLTEEPAAASPDERHIDTLVIGAGQAGLAAGYYLTQAGVPCEILDGSGRVGDVWRHRWDSLRLFTPRPYNGLPGMAFPADSDYFPTKDAMADFLEEYARHFELPVRTSVRVARLSRDGAGFRADTTAGTYTAGNVIVAMGTFQRPRLPAFAADLAPDVVQLHSCDYRNPDQLRDGPVLIVGAGNSGAEIAKDLATHHETWLAGRHPGQLPFRLSSRVGKALGRVVLRFVFHRVLTVATPMGRKARPAILSKGGPLIRVRKGDLDKLGVHRVGRVERVTDGRPALAGGDTLDVANVIWCTGFEPGFDWIDLPVMGEHEPRHRAGIVDEAPGLYFLGLEFLYAMSSAMVHGVDRDARRIVDHLVARASVSA